MEYMNLENQATISDGESGILDNESSSYEQFGFLVRNGMVRVEEREDDALVNMIKKVFLNSTTKFGDDSRIVAIHRHSRLGLAGKSWAERFRICSDAVAEKNGGAANIKSGWYGGPKGEILEILSYGFGLGKRPLNSKLFGHGVYLSPSNFSIDCVASSTADENGLRHMLLCRVLLGNTEEVCVGSDQYHPSCTEFDSGVDNLSAPTKYIIWSPYMNSHIFPSFVISFTFTPSRDQFPSLKILEQNLDATVRSSAGELSTRPRRGATIYSSDSNSKKKNSKLTDELSKHLDSSNVEYRNLDDMIRSSTGCAATNSSRAMHSTIPNLIKILAKYLDFSKRVSVAEVYSDFRQKTITKVQMIRSLKTIVGDELLRAVLMEFFKPATSFPKSLPDASSPPKIQD